MFAICFISDIQTWDRHKAVTGGLGDSGEVSGDMNMKDL